MNNLKKIVAALLAIGCAAGPLAVNAQELNAVEVSGDVKAVQTSVDESGNETTQLVDPGVIIPGGRLVFGTDYTNNSDESAENFVVTNPLPSAVRLAPNADPDLIVSVDGGETWGTLAALSVTTEDGIARSATHGDVTHVRWTLASIAPGESGRLEYPAIIR